MHTSFKDNDTLGKFDADAAKSPRQIEDILNDIAVNSRNSALEAAAKVAKLYGAPDEACERILMLKGNTKEPA
jgi:hypothetical protein